MFRNLFSFGLPGFLNRRVNLIIPGAQKAGTTALCYYLNQSRFVSIPVSEKHEFHYFSNLQTDLDGYHNSLYELVNRYSWYVGEKSTSYLPNLECHSRIYEYNPRMKFIVLLREPVSRAFSRYKDKVQDSNFEYDKDFAKCVDKSIRQNHHWTWWGCYADHLKSLYSYFPRNQVLVIFQEDLIADPNLVLRQVFRFLGVPRPKLSPVVRHANSLEMKLPEVAERKLKRFYDEKNQELKELLGIKKLPW